MSMIKQDIDAWLDQVDYKILNSADYMPSEFALTYMNFIKLVNGGVGESHKTPPVHLKMLDKVVSGRDYTANLCFRGSGKALDVNTPILTEKGWSTVSDLKVGDSVFGEDGKLTKITFKSEIFTKPMYRITLGDGRQLNVCEDHINVVIRKRVKRVEGKCVSYYSREEIPTKELISIPLGSTRSKTSKNPNGWENSIWIPCSKAVDLPVKDLPIEPYLLGLILGDGSMCNPTGSVRFTSHKDDLPEYLPYLNNIGAVRADTRNTNVITCGILKLGKCIKKMGLNIHGDYKFIPPEYLHGSIEQRLALLQGLMDTDGDATGTFSSNSIQLAQGVQYLVYSLGGVAKLSSGQSASGKQHYRVSCNLDLPLFRLKRKLTKYKRKYLGKVPIVSIEATPIVDSQCIAVDNQSHTFLANDFVVTHNTTLFMEYFCLFVGVFHYLPNFGSVDGLIYVSDSMDNGVKSARKNIEFRYNNSEFCQQWIPHATFTDNYIEFANREGQLLGIKMFGAKTGLRGTKIFGKRPKIAILDDLVSDEDSNSLASMEKIKDTVYKGVNHALDPTKRKVIFNGTPFNKGDILVEAVESGAWDVNVWPVCEQFPCTEEEFSGAWPDRFSYAYIKEQYDMAEKTGKLSGFYQELMLRLTSEEERLVTDAEINWYQRKKLLANLGNFNFYITTDLANSEKKKSDNSVISVWAYNSNGDWFWVDGICERQTMDKNINDLFRLVQMYRPQQVGIEITGQQVAFIKWLQGEMINRNVWFNFASSDTSNTPGIRPMTSKLARFNIVVPWFKMGKMFFPEEMKQSKIMGQFMQELRLATFSGLKGKDDCIDTISMLGFLKPWKPSESLANVVDDHGVWGLDDSNDAPSSLASYLV